jgi:hypothetical protein
VSKTLLNHLSLIRFIDYNWDLPSLTQNVARSNNLLDFFDFNGAIRKPIILGSPGSFSATAYPIPLQIPIAELRYTRAGSWSGTASRWEPPTAVYVAAVAVAILIVAFIIASRSRKE